MASQHDLITQENCPPEKTNPTRRKRPFLADKDNLVWHYLMMSHPRDDYPEVFINDIENILLELKPKGALEKMLVSLLLANFYSIRDQFKDADQTSDPVHKEKCLNAAVRLQKMFMQQLKELDRMRGNRQQQTRIGNINISGGQSIIASHVENQKTPE